MLRVVQKIPTKQVQGSVALSVTDPLTIKLIGVNQLYMKLYQYMFLVPCEGDIALYLLGRD